MGCNWVVFINMPHYGYLDKFVKVKIFLALILSFIVFTETIVPCCLWDDCRQEENSAAHSGEKKSTGDCSPFATCSACAAAVLISKQFTVAFAVPKLHITHTAAPQYFILSSYNKSLLQPPRLS
jgi:hypothetical protein